MRVGEVADLVAEWVDLYGRNLPGFCGAYLFGGIATLPADAEFALYRDVDLIIVLDSGTRGTDENLEVSYKGLMLEVGFIGLDEHHNAREVVARPDRAGTIAGTRILADPLGVLTPLQAAVRRSYADPAWIAARCTVEKEAVCEGLDAMAAAHVPLARVLACTRIAFAMAGLLDIAQLQVPTSRRALIRMKQHLEDKGRRDLHEDVLRIHGADTVSAAQAREYHHAMLSLFDRAVEVKRTPTPYSYKIEAHTRPYVDQAIGEMIEEGHHREAMLYLTLNYAAVNFVMQNDAPEHEKATAQAGLEGLLDALDLLTPRRWRARVELARRCAEQVSAIADAWVAAYANLPSGRAVDLK